MRKAIHLMTWIFLLQGVGFFMGQLTQANISPWYNSLLKSSLTPPGYVFGIVWTLLYVMLGISGWLLWQDTRENKQLCGLFVVQLLLNWLWTPLFFYYHWVGVALVCLLGIVLLTSCLMRLAHRKKRVVFFLLLPYWLWVCFAAYLNGYVWVFNVPS